MEPVDYETLFKDRYDTEKDAGYEQNRNKNCHRFQPVVKSWLKYRQQGMNNQSNFKSDRMRDRRGAPYDRRDASYDHRSTSYDRRDTSYGRRDTSYDRRDTQYDRRDTHYDRRDASYDRHDATYDLSKRANIKDNQSHAGEADVRSRRPKKKWRSSQNHQKEADSIILKDKEALKEAIRRHQQK